MHGLGMITTIKIDQNSGEQTDESQIAGYWKHGEFCEDHEFS